MLAFLLRTFHAPIRTQDLEKLPKNCNLNDFELKCRGVEL